MDIKSILQELGYPIQEHSNYYKTRGIYRGGRDINSLTIYYKENLVIDHVAGERFSIEELIKRTLLFDNDEKIKEWLKNKNITLPVYNPNSVSFNIIQSETFSEEEVKDLLPDYDYFINRGISDKACITFRGGLCNNGTLKDRQCLLIINSKNQIVGVTGRDVTNKKKIKWMHRGVKSKWVWPAYLSHSDIGNCKEIILVESPLCCMRLWDCGVKNTICLFGVEISNAVINYLLRVHPKKIIVALNNEESHIGNNAANKVRDRLIKYFDSHVIKIHLPPAKDFAEIKEDDIIKKWYEER